MKTRSRSFGWFVVLASMTWFGCGSSDDDANVPAPGLDGAVMDVRPRDADGGDSAAPEARADAQAAGDTDAAPPPEIDAETDGSFVADADGGVGADALADELAPSDASVDAMVEGTLADSSIEDTSIVEAPADTSPADEPDAGLPVDVSSEPADEHTTPPVDAGVDSGPDTSFDAGAPDVSQGNADAHEGGSEDHVDVATPIDVAMEVVPDGGDIDAVEDLMDASIDASDVSQDVPLMDALNDPNGDTDDAPQKVHWKIEASPPECSADPSVVFCLDNGTNFEVYVQTPCATFVADADLWFAPGDAPAPGQYVVHPSSDPSDLANVTGQEVGMEFTRMSPSEAWWVQSGTVDVQLVDGKRIIQFSDLSAFEGSDHSRTTTIGGLIICGTAGSDP
jgi:hypothetical protein